MVAGKTKLYENSQYNHPGMVLSGQTNEQIFIIPKGEKNYQGKAICITIAKVRGKRVKVGINADSNSYLVHRKEVLQEVEDDGELEKGLMGE